MYTHTQVGDELKTALVDNREKMANELTTALGVCVWICQAETQITVPFKITVNLLTLSELRPKTFDQSYTSSLSRIGRNNCLSWSKFSQDSKCALRDSFYHSPFLSQVLQRLPTRISTALHSNYSSDAPISHQQLKPTGLPAQGV